MVRINYDYATIYTRFIGTHARCDQMDAWQRERAWGSAVVEQMAQDLQDSYPGVKGLSRSSLFAMRQFYAFFSPRFEVVP